MLDPPVLSGQDGSVQAAQVHIGGNDQRSALIDRVPGWNFQGSRLVFFFQCSFGQPDTVVGLGHNLKLHRPSVITREKVDWKLKASVCTPVRN